MEAMSEYAPDSLENNSALGGLGHDAAVRWRARRSSAPTSRRSENIAAAANTLKNFDGDGLMQPVTFPEMHESMAPCMGFGQVQGGEWKLTAGTDTDPFLCGTPVAATG